MNQRILISISISLAIHILILCLLKLSGTALEISKKESRNTAFTVTLKTPNISESSFAEITSKLSDVSKNEVNTHNLQHTPYEKPQASQIDQFSLFTPEPKYYALKELDNPLLMVTDINTKPAELEQYNEGGEIKVQIWIDEEGNVIKSEIVNSNLPQAFIDYTLESFNQAKFLPGIKDGVPVRAIAKVVVQYAEIE